MICFDLGHHRNEAPAVLVFAVMLELGTFVLALDRARALFHLEIRHRTDRQRSRAREHGHLLELLERRAVLLAELHDEIDLPVVRGDPADRP